MRQKFRLRVWKNDDKMTELFHFHTGNNHICIAKGFNWKTNRLNFIKKKELFKCLYIIITFCQATLFCGLPSSFSIQLFEYFKSYIYNWNFHRILKINFQTAIFNIAKVDVLLLLDFSSSSSCLLTFCPSFWYSLTFVKSPFIGGSFVFSFPAAALY